jgi:hypothetical protein
MTSNQALQPTAARRSVLLRTFANRFSFQVALAVSGG